MSDLSPAQIESSLKMLSSKVLRLTARMNRLHGTCSLSPDAEGCTPKGGRRRFRKKRKTKRKKRKKRKRKRKTKRKRRR